MSRQTREQQRDSLIMWEKYLQFAEKMRPDLAEIQVSIKFDLDNF